MRIPSLDETTLWALPFIHSDVTSFAIEGKGQLKSHDIIQSSLVQAFNNLRVWDSQPGCTNLKYLCLWGRGWLSTRGLWGLVNRGPQLQSVELGRVFESEEVLTALGQLRCLAKVWLSHLGGSLLDEAPTEEWFPVLEEVGGIIAGPMLSVLSQTCTSRSLYVWLPEGFGPNSLSSHLSDILHMSQETLTNLAIQGCPHADSLCPPLPPSLSNCFNLRYLHLSGSISMDSSFFHDTFHLPGLEQLFWQPVAFRSYCWVSVSTLQNILGKCPALRVLDVYPPQGQPIFHLATVNQPGEAIRCTVESQPEEYG